MTKFFGLLEELQFKKRQVIQNLNDPELERAHREIIIQTENLLENLSGFPVKDLEDKINIIQNEVKEDVELESAWEDLLNFMRCSINSPKDVERDSWCHLVIEKIERVKIHIYKYRSMIFALLQDIDDLITNIREDKTLQEFSGSVEKLASDLFYEENGHLMLKPEAFQMLPLIFKPLLEQEFKYIAIPPMVNKDKEMDYEITNAVMKVRGLFPDQIVVENSTYLHSGKKQNVKATAQLYVSIKGMVLDVRDMHVRYRKYTFPKLADQGTASVSFSNANVELWLSGDANDSQLFHVDKVDVDLRGMSLHDLDFERHEFLYYVFKPLIKHKVRKEIEQKIEEQLLNKLFNIGTMVVDIVEQVGLT